MQAGKAPYEFTATLWQYSGNGGWHFVSLPKALAKEIRTHLQWQEEGWGRMQTTAFLGEFEWKTAIWFDTKLDTYILPIKSEIRKKFKCKVDDALQLKIWV